MGAPFRLALSTGGKDNFETCTLLNHIPHHDVIGGPTLRPGFYSIVVDMPDIDCPKCALQLIQFMTDKVTNSTDGTTSGCVFDPQDTTGLTSPTKCFSNYFSCADIAITGKTPINQFVCPKQPQNWVYGSKQPYFMEKFETGSWKINATNGIRTLSDPALKEFGKFKLY